MYSLLDRVIGWLARWTALVGGVVLLVVVALTCISIIGRAFSFAGLGPIQGDFEIVELGVGFGIFAFLPWCQYARGHARVDLFTPLFGNRPNRVIDLVADALMLVAALVITWRLWQGMEDKFRYMETTFILHLPQWYGYASAMFGAVVFCLTAAFCVIRSTRELKGEVYEQH